MKIVIATIKSWNINNAVKFKKKNKNIDIHIITEKERLTYEELNKIKPEYVFFPHWSWIIPKEIYNNFTCIVFHMTDLPFGRGGSPLQNLIERGIENTKITAIKVDGGIDTGDIYLKEELNLNGTAEEIYMRSSEKIFNIMIPKIISETIIPKSQSGEVTEFKRRRYYQSEIKKEFKLKKIYDYIRMLDAEGYPNAFIRYGNYKIEFSRASLKNGKIIADAVIKEVDENE